MVEAEEVRVKSKESLLPPPKKKRPATAPNPLSNRAPQLSSKSYEKKKAKKYRRGG